MVSALLRHRDYVKSSTNEPPFQYLALSGDNGDFQPERDGLNQQAERNNQQYKACAGCVGDGLESGFCGMSQCGATQCNFH